MSAGYSPRSSSTAELTRSPHVEDAIMKNTLDALIEEPLVYEADAFENDEAVSGANLVEWFVDWRRRVRAAMDVVQSHSSEDSPCHRR